MTAALKLDPGTLDPGSVVVLFRPGAPDAPASAPPRSPRPSAADLRLLDLVRGWARRSQLHAPLVLHRACAAIAPAEDVETHGLMLLRALSAACAQRLVLHPRGAAEVSLDEAFLLRLLERIRAGDDASARFLIRRRVDRRDQRMTLFLADRLATALDAVESRRAR